MFCPDIRIVDKQKEKGGKRGKRGKRKGNGEIVPVYFFQIKRTGRYNNTQMLNKIESSKVVAIAKKISCKTVLTVN